MQVSLSSGGGVDNAPRQLRQRLRRPLMFAVPVLAALAGGANYQANAPYVTTDDAFVRANKGTINARVAGQVVEIAVKDNQPVQKGQLLFRLDPEPYQIAVDQAEARLNSAQLQVTALKATYRQQLAELQSAKDSADFSQQELDRKRALLASDFTPRAAFDRATTDLKVARQHIASLQHQAANTVAALNGDPEIDAGRHPLVREAKAQLDRARLDLAYTRVTAPDDGIVTKVDDLQLGDFVNGGAAVFAMMSNYRLWIEANFRETDLTHMHPGQPATITVDAYPGQDFRAHVASMSPGTGSDLAMLPPENATGNWVKVVQRLPIRLELDDFDPRHPLFSGISVTARVDTRRSGSTDAAPPATPGAQAAR